MRDLFDITEHPVVVCVAAFLATVVVTIGLAYGINLLPNPLAQLNG